MKKKKTFIIVLAFVMSFISNGVMKADTTGTKIVGGDLSLVPAYVAAKDSWKDTDGNTISTTEGMINFVKNLGWNAVRVRLFVDPSQDSDPATCQNIDYVRKLGKIIKDAGLYFLVDFHFSDTWADPDSQKIPARWETTTDAALADSVYAFTKESLQALVAYGANPDYVQVGNEINGGMLWTTSDGEAPSSSSDYATYGYCDAWSSRSSYTTCWDRLCRFLNQGTTAVREVCPNAKIIIHNAIEGNSTYGEYAHTALVNFYTYISQNATYPVSYDIIGLSYYPAWHGTLDYLGTTLTNLQESFPTKEIQVVETGWYHSNYPSDAKFSSTTSPSLDWAVSALGQYNYLNDLTSTLNGSAYSHVTGLYYWQPEECGNGHSSSGSTNTVMNKWDNRGFWVNGTTIPHALLSGNVSTTTETDYSSYFSNLDFENCTYTSNYISKVPGWTLNYNLSWSKNWAENTSDYTSSLVGGTYMSYAYTSASTTAGNLIYQTATVPAGTYKVTAVVHAESSGIYVMANDTKTEVTSTSDWGTAYTVSATTTLSKKGTLTIGLYSNAQTSSSVYSDNFTVTKVETSSSGETVYPINELTDFSGTYTDNFTTNSTTIEGITYSVNLNKGTASVTGTTSDLTNDVYVPSTITYDGTTYNVTSIADEAFKDNTTINSIHTANSITSVGASACSGCTNLLYACLGTGVTSIGDNAFAGCNLNVLVLNSSSAITYGTTPFCGAATGTSVFLSSTEFDKSSTYTGFGFSSDNICKTDIKNGVIYGLWGTHNAFVVGYTEDIPANIIIPSTLHYDEDKYVPCTQYFMDMIEQYAFAKAPGLTTVTVCNNTNQIGSCAFRNCTSLTSATFGEDATTFYDYIFYGDSKLKSVTIYNSSAPGTWGTNSLSGVTLNCPYASASTAYSGFSTYSTLNITSTTLSDKSTTDVTKSSLIADNSTTYGAQNVTIGRTIAADRYYTIVLPWDLNETEVTALGFTPYYLNSSWIDTNNNNKLWVYFNQTTTMQGGVPYLVKCSTAYESGLNLGLEFTFEYKENINPTKGNVQFKGLYYRTKVPQGDFFISGNYFCYAASDAINLGAFRAYIHIPESVSAKPTSLGFSVEDFNGETNKIEQIDADTFVSTDGNIYDITGRLLKNPPVQKGIYIINGKKVLVK